MLLAIQQPLGNQYQSVHPLSYERSFHFLPVTYAHLCFRLHSGFAFEEHYRQFLPSLKTEEAIDKIQRYEQTKDYNMDIMDAAALFLANSIPCVLVVHSHNCSQPQRIVPCNPRYIDELKEVHLLLDNQHYDALIPENKIKLCKKLSSTDLSKTTTSLDFEHASTFDLNSVDSDHNSEELTDFLQISGPD